MTATRERGSALAAVWRGGWGIVHVLCSAFVVLWLGVTRRGKPMVLVHYQDVDATGRDRQMGPLVDALRARGGCSIVAAIPFGPQLWVDWWRRGTASVSLAFVLVPARLLSPAGGREARMRARVRVARWLLALVRPSVVFLIDESGSGQPLLRAARQLGTRVVGIQHGDFLPGNPQYDPGGEAFDIEPADVLCVWSPWFQRRLLAMSPIYDVSNTVVCGRLRYPAPEQPAELSDPERATRVLVIGEAGATFGSVVAPFVAALRDAPDIEVEYCAHPGETTPHANGVAVPSLHEALPRSDVVVGVSSSALLEAVYWRRPVVVVAVGDASHDDPARLVRDGLAEPCTDPACLAELCRRLARSVGEKSGGLAESARASIWGEPPERPVEGVLAAGS